MKEILFIALFSLGMLNAGAQIWKKEQIMPTADLASMINTNSKDLPIIFNVGPMDNIKKSVFIGRATSATFVDNMKKELNMVPKTKTVVVYCGCCSFGSCPNLKPAYEALIGLGYKNARVLEIPEGIKPDWVAKGYPMEQ